MGTAGAYAGTSFSFNYSFIDSATPSSFFATDLTTSDVTVYSRSGSTTGAGAAIASAPTRSGSIYTFTLSTSEMVGDEVLLECSKTGMVSETISIALEPTPSDISEVQKSAVSISDFRATGFSTFDPASDTVANVTTVASVSGAVGSVTAAVTTDVPPTAAAMADAVWDEARSSHTSAGSFGEGVKVESLNTQAKADVNAEADTAISDASLATSSALSTAQTDLDTLTGSDGVTLATSQPNYAPNVTTPPTAAAIRAEVDSNSTQLAAIVADTNEIQTDLANGGRLDLILDSILDGITSSRSEPSAGAPPSSASLVQKVDYLYKFLVNKKTQTSDTYKVFNSDGATVDHQATVSDDGTTATFGEIGAGS